MWAALFDVQQCLADEVLAAGDGDLPAADAAGRRRAPLLRRLNEELRVVRRSARG